MINQESELDLLEELSVDAPIARMRSRLERTLANPPRRAARPIQWLSWAAASLVLLVAFATWWSGAPRPDSAATEVQAVLELLAAPSAFERIRGVNRAADLAPSLPQLRAALFERLETDASVNVRLSALDALVEVKLSTSEADRLVGTLSTQKKAIVQAQLGHQLRRRRFISRAELERLLERPGIQEGARTALNRLEES